MDRGGGEVDGLVAVAPRRRLHLGPFVAVAAVAALAGTGHPLGALALGGVTLLVHQCRALIPAVAATADRATTGLRHAVGRGLTMALLTIVFVLIVLPVSAVTFPFRRRTMGQPRGVTGWVTRAADDRPTEDRAPDSADAPPAPVLVDRPHSSDPRRRPLPVGRALGRVAWIVLVAMVLDLALGATLSGTRLLVGDRAQLHAAQLREWNATMQSPAIRDEPWAEQYRLDQDGLASLPQEYVPYLVWGFQEYHSQWVNTSDRERRSYEPTIASGQRPLRVAFFGGSVLFGIGQRDSETIPSQFARLAERSGLPVEVHNYGMFGWARWQEYEYLERLLAAGEQYDLVVVYDGLNDYMLQFSDPSADPTHGGSKILERLGDEIHREEYQFPGFLDGFHDLATTYRENSGVARVVDRIVNGGSNLPDWLQTSEPVDVGAASTAALDIYGRSGRAMSLLTDDHHVPIRFFLQATQIDWTPEQLAQMPPGTGNYSDVFDGIESSVYIDGAHTNERGARLVAQRLWRDLEPDLRRAEARANPSDDG